jgi:hypothetical protein
MDLTVNQTKQEAQEPQSEIGEFCTDALGERRRHLVWRRNGVATQVDRNTAYAPDRRG